MRDLRKDLGVAGCCGRCAPCARDVLAQCRQDNHKNSQKISHKDHQRSTNPFPAIAQSVLPTAG